MDAIRELVRPENEPLYRLQAEMDWQYRALISDKPESIEVPMSGEFSVSRLYGRRLGYMMAFICDRMKEEVEKSQLRHDFPKNERIAWNIFNIFNGDMLPWGGNIKKRETIYGKMTEEEVQIIKEIQAKIEHLPQESIYDYNCLALGSFEGMITYIYHRPLSLLCEEVDIDIKRRILRQ